MSYHDHPGAYPAPQPPPPARKRRGWIALVVVLLVVAAAATIVLTTRDDDSDSSGPEAAFREMIELRTTGQFGQLYETMHPAQQAIIDRETFMQCGAQELQESGLVGDIDVDVTETYPETVPIAGTDERVESTALVVRLGIMGEEVTDTVHLVKVDGVWRWLEPNPENYQATTNPMDPPSCTRGGA